MLPLGRNAKHEVEPLLDRRLFHRVTLYLVPQLGHSSPCQACQWQRAEELDHSRCLVAEY